MSDEMKTALRQYTIDFLTMAEDMGVTDPELILEEMMTELREEVINQIEQNI